MDSSRKSPINIKSVATVMLMALLVVGYGIFNKKMLARRDTAVDPIANQGVIPSQPIAAGYKNGTYSAVGSYISPGGTEEVGVTVVIENGMIINSSVAIMSERPISAAMQQDFADNYKQFVIGKNIDEVKLDKVSASSLTPVGFNDALAKIKAEARS